MLTYRKTDKCQLSIITVALSIILLFQGDLLVQGGCTNDAYIFSLIIEKCFKIGADFIYNISNVKDDLVSQATKLSHLKPTSIMKRGLQGATVQFIELTLQCALSGYSIAD